MTIFLEIASNIPFIFSSLWPLPDLEKLQKFFHWRGLQHTSFLCLFMLLLVLNFWPQLLQSNTGLLCCQIVCLQVLAKTYKPCHRHYGVKHSLSLLCCSCVLHQLLAAVKPHLTVFARKLLKLCWKINFFFKSFLADYA